MNDILLSVIVANYNNESYIRESLDSILNQAYKSLEIIVSDDRSTDSSPGVIAEYEKKYPGIVKGVFKTENSGVAQTRHEGILQAEGKYITTLDSDDYYYDSQKLEKEMALIASYKEKTGEAIIAYSNIVLVNGDKTKISPWGNQGNIREGMILDEIMGRSCMIPRDFIMTKDAYFEAGGYDNRIPIYEDWDLKIRLAARYPFYYTGINGTAYRRHGQGLSSLPVPEHEKWLNIIFDKNFRLMTPETARQIQQKFKEYIELIKR